MADSKISGLTTGTIAASDDIVFVNSGTTKTDTVQGILDLIPSGGNLGDTNLTADANRTYTLNGSLSTDTLIVKNAAAAAIATFRGDGTFFGKNVGFGAAPQSSYAGYFVSNGLSGGINIAGNAALGITSATSNANGVAVRAVPTGSLSPVGIFSQMTHSATGNKAAFSADLTGAATSNVGFLCDISGGTANYAFNIIDGDFKFSTSTGTMIGVGTTDKFSFWGATPITQPTALTTQLTSITGDITPASPDYVVAATSGGWGCGSQDEFETVMNVINNLQTRVQELEDALSTAAGGSGLIA